MTEETALTIRLGSLEIASPEDVIRRATAISKELAKIVESCKLYTLLNGRKFVRVEGWTTMGGMLGVLPREVSAERQEDGGYLAVVELVRVSDGAIIGRGSALCGMDEHDRNGNQTWGGRAEYARRSMSITRATGKAYRLGFSWIMTLAGYEPTPAEEMDGVIEGQVIEPAESPKKDANAEPKEKPTNGKAEAIYQAVVDAGLSENIHAARNLLGRCRTGYDTPEKAVAWCKLYRGWKDIGGDTDQAVKLANSGEIPK